MILPALKIITVIGCLAACGYYACCIFAEHRFAAELRNRRKPILTRPISILKPLCGADPHAYESLRSHCLQDYPEFEIVFGVRDPDDAAVGLVQRLREEFPALRLHLVLCPHTL